MPFAVRFPSVSNLYPSVALLFDSAFPSAFFEPGFFTQPVLRILFLSRFSVLYDFMLLSDSGGQSKFIRLLLYAAHNLVYFVLISPVCFWTVALYVLAFIPAPGQRE